MTPEARPYVWNNIAWLDVMIDAPDLRDEADDFSRQALQELPWVSLFKGTRGAVLIDTGRLDEGMALLGQAHRENFEVSHKALNSCYLAIARARKGDTAGAREHIGDAKRRDPGCPLIDRAVNELEQCSIRATE